VHLKQITREFQSALRAPSYLSLYSLLLQWCLKEMHRGCFKRVNFFTLVLTRPRV